MTKAIKKNGNLEPALPTQPHLFGCQVNMAADQDRFQQILTSLLSTDNEVRTQAEVQIVLKIYYLHSI